MPIITIDQTALMPKQTTHIERAKQRMSALKYKRKHNLKGICVELFPLNIWSMVHHKTGHDFSWSLGTKLQNFCNLRDKPLVTEFSIMRFLKACKPVKCAYLHWVRHPLNTIISGYYYHLKTDEEWVSDLNIGQSVNTAIEMDIFSLFVDISNDMVNGTNYFEKYRKDERLKKNDPKMPLIECFDIGKKSILYKFVDDFVENEIMSHQKFVLNENITLQRFYQNLHGIDYKIGLFYEFVRYFNCEWAAIYVLQQIGEQYYENVREYDIDRFVNGYFDENVNGILIFPRMQF